MTHDRLRPSPFVVLSVFQQTPAMSAETGIPMETVCKCSEVRFHLAFAVSHSPVGLILVRYNFFFLSLHFTQAMWCICSTAVN